MDEEIGSEKTSIPNIQMRRSIFQGHSMFNLVDAKGEIEFEHALQLHKSSPLSSVTEKKPTVTGNISTHEIDLSMFSDAQYCYSLLEAMPLPGPTWSTTAPSVLAEPPSATIEASVESEWGENQASSYTWWLGFLQSLDDNKTGEKLDHPFVENIGMENSMVLSRESSFVDAIDLSCCPNDWLMVPTMEKELGDMVMP